MSQIEQVDPLVEDEDGVRVPEASKPSMMLTATDWVKKNLFSSLFNSLLTLVIGVVAIFLAIIAARWVINEEFEIIRVNLANFMIGQFDRDELWRLWASGYLFLLAVGLTSGALARSGHELALTQDLPTEKESLFSMVRRFWAVIAVMIFFVTFARTVPPYIALAVAFVIVVIARELGWHLPSAVRRSAVFIGATLGVLSILVVAGTSDLGGVILGAIAFVWISTELGRVNASSGFVASMTRLGPAAVVGVIIWLIVRSIGFDGFGWAEWGGLHVTLFTAIVGVTAGMPFGILLALGRRSDLPVLKTASVIFIEFVRGVPLISLLLASGLLLPLFLPVDLPRPADLTLAIIVITMFSSAYIAEIVRGGLQAVPKGQTEAAQASGMSAFNVQRLIVLPQALRAVIPAMVGQFIALFKDTSLLSIIGILEFLRASDVSNAQPQFAGANLAGVTLLFVAIGYWAFAYTLSKESRRLEAKLGVGTR